MKQKVKDILQKLEDIKQQLKALQAEKNDLAVELCPHKVDELADINGQQILVQRVTAPLQYGEANTWTVHGRVMADGKLGDSVRVEQKDVSDG